MRKIFDDPLYMARYRRNLTVLKNRYNFLYRYLEDTNDPRLDILLCDERLCVYKGNDCIYEANPNHSLYDMIRNDLKFSCLGPTRRGQVEDKIITANQMYHKFYSRIHDIIEEYTASGKSFQVGKRHLPLVFLYGIADGKRIELLLHTFDIRHVVLLVENVEMLRISLFFANWSRILDLIQSKNIEFTVILSNDQEVMYQEALSAANKINPSFIYSALHLFQYYNQTFIKTYEDICKEAYKLFYLWPVDTEIQNCKATIQNVKEKPEILRSQTDPTDKPVDGLSAAAVIGAGPSIDTDIQVLRENYRNMTVFSCGTALLTLYENDIVPDYHIDIERQNNHQIYLKYVNKEYMRNIHVLYPIYFRPLPENAYLFKDCSYFYKQNEYYQYMIKNTQGCLNICGGVTVTSHAFDIALQLGFDVIVLLGCDLAFLDNQEHHSVHHWHNRNTARQKDVSVQEDKNELKIRQGYFNTPFTVPGNFRTNVKTNRNLFCELGAYNRLTKKNANAIVFNLSDGVQIKHTFPLPSDYLNTTNFRKMMIHQNRKSSSEIDLYSVQNLHFLYKAVVQDFENMLSQPLTDFGRFIDQYMDLQSYMKSKLAKHQPVLYKILENTMLQYMTSIFSNAYAIEDEKIALEFAERSNAVICDFLHELEAEIEILQEEGFLTEYQAV